MPTPLIAADEVARRVRAAAAYAGIDHDELAAATGITVPTLRRIVSKSAPRGASAEERWSIADACQVPRWFLETGFAIVDPAAGSGDFVVTAMRRFGERMAAVENAVGITPPSETDPREAAARALEEAAEQAERKPAPGAEGTAGQDRQTGSA